MKFPIGGGYIIYITRLVCLTNKRTLDRWQPALVKWTSDDILAAFPIDVLDCRLYSPSPGSTFVCSTDQKPAAQSLPNPHPTWSNAIAIRRLTAGSNNRESIFISSSSSDDDETFPIPASSIPTSSSTSHRHVSDLCQSQIPKLRPAQGQRRIIYMLPLHLGVRVMNELGIDNRATDQTSTASGTSPWLRPHTLPGDAMLKLKPSGPCRSTTAPTSPPGAFQRQI